MCKKNLNMIKCVCVGSLQSAEISVGKPRWSATFVKELKQTRNENMELQTLPEVTHHGTQCITSNPSNVEAALLNDLSTHMQMSMEKLHMVRNFKNISKCFRGEDALSWLTSPEILIGSIVRISERDIARTTMLDDDEEEDDEDNEEEEEEEEKVNKDFAYEVIGYESEQYLRVIPIQLDRDSVGVMCGHTFQIDDGIFKAGSRIRIFSEHPTFAGKTGVVYFCSSRVRDVEVKKKRRQNRDYLVNLLFDDDDVLQPLRCLRKSMLNVGYNAGDLVRLLDDCRHLTSMVGTVLST